MTHDQIILHCLENQKKLLLYVHDNCPAKDVQHICSGLEFDFNRLAVEYINNQIKTRQIKKNDENCSLSRHN